MTKNLDKEAETFEKAFSRLEEILQLMNSDKLALEESLSLFEEANKLIVQCDKKLASAQNKIETLIKNRSGDLVLDESQKPVTENFTGQVNEKLFT
jgi:exodeoxyribonuclease VII small subunit